MTSRAFSWIEDFSHHSLSSSNNDDLNRNSEADARQTTYQPVAYELALEPAVSTGRYSIPNWPATNFGESLAIYVDNQSGVVVNFLKDKINAIDSTITVFARGGGGGGGGGGSGSGSVLSSYSSGGGLDGYDVTIEFKGSLWTAELQAAFKSVADYVTGVIKNDIGGNTTVRGKFIDDLYVTAELATIDSLYGVLGSTGLTGTWVSSGLTATGSMKFDVADATSLYQVGIWDDVVCHEFFHVLGFGSLWKSSFANGAAYTGTNALSEYKKIQGNSNASYIPIEQDGGPGTAGSHWDESALTTEVMTGYIDSTNYMSSFTVASLADVGYVMNSFTPFNL